MTAQIGSNVENMGETIFVGCTTLKKLKCDSSVGASSFKDCDALESVTLGMNVKGVGVQAFYGCKKLLEVILPEGVEAIGARAFYNCETMKKLSLPSTLKNVGSEFFYGTQELRTIYYNGSSDQWGRVDKEDNWSKNISGGITWINDFEIKTPKKDKE